MAVEMNCVNCHEPIRRVQPGDGIDPRDYQWVHSGQAANPVCDFIPVASPGGDGYGPAPVAGYVIDGKRYHPADVTIIRRES